MLFIKQKKQKIKKTRKPIFKDSKIHKTIKFFLTQIHEIVWISWRELAKDSFYVLLFSLVLLSFFLIVDALLNYLLKFFV